MKRIVLAPVLVFGVAIGLVFSFSPAVSAQEGGSLIIGVSPCPDGYEGQDFAADCVEAAAGVGFFIGSPNTGNTSSTTSRGDGVATFNLGQFDLDPTGPDAAVVGEPATQTGDFAVACTRNDGGALDFVTQVIPFEPGGMVLGISFEFETGDDIACEWYRLSLLMPGEVNPPARDDSDDAGEVVAAELPNTGVGPVTSSGGTSASELLLAGLLAIS